jgi:hypothetical protein
MSGFTLTRTGAWDDEDPEWWARVFALHNLYEWLYQDERDKAPKDKYGGIQRAKRFVPMTLDDEPPAPIALGLSDL